MPSRPKNLLILMVPFLFSLNLLWAQAVQDVTWDVSEDSTIVVHYQLVDPIEGKLYKVKLEFSTNGGASFLSAKTTSGDVNEVYRGGVKEIYWDALSDVGSLESDRFVVKVIASETRGVTERLSDVFFGSDETRIHVNGWSLYASGSQYTFKSRYYGGLKKTGLIKDQYGYGGGLRFFSLPFLLDVNGFYQKYRTFTIADKDAEVVHWG